MVLPTSKSPSHLAPSPISPSGLFPCISLSRGEPPAKQQLLCSLNPQGLPPTHPSSAERASWGGGRGGEEGRGKGGALTKQQEKETEGLECLCAGDISSSQWVRDMKAQFPQHIPLANCSPNPVSFQQASRPAPPPGTMLCHVGNSGLMPTPTDTVPALGGPGISMHLGPPASSRPTTMFQ